MPLKSYAEVRQFLSGIMLKNHLEDEIPKAPHKDFWNSLTYEQFTMGNMPNLKIPVRILIKGNSTESNLILSLKGEGPMFNNTTGKPGPMPPKGPMFSKEQIKELADWIDAECPK